MIVRGPTDSDFNQAHKAHARLIESLSIQEDRVAQEHPTIRFGPEDFTGVVFLNIDALVIQATITNYKVSRVLVDFGSSINVLFQEVFVRMQLEEARLEEIATSLFSFAMHAVQPIG